MDADCAWGLFSVLTISSWTFSNSGSSATTYSATFSMFWRQSLPRKALLSAIV